MLAALAAEGIDAVALQAPRLDPWRFDRRVAWDQVLLPLAAARARARVLHATSGTVPLLRTLPAVVTVHDLAWLRVQAHTRPYARAYFGGLMARAYVHAERIVADSAFSRGELLDLVRVDPARVEVVYPGVDADVMVLERARNDARPFALAVGTVERRKNLVLAIDAIARVPGLNLVSVGPPTPYLDECRRRARSLGVEDRVMFRGYVSRKELLALYRTATLALVPSRYEGFGYAVAQALCAGVPVLAAATSSLVEVAGRDGTLLSPDDIVGWQDAIEHLLNDPAAADARAAASRASAHARFAWQTAAKRLGAIYTALAP